jgi:bla regulator protein blaR1
MMSTLARASIDGAIIVAAIWIVTRLLRLSPATRAVLWWCAAAKFVLALAWTTPVTLPILPAQAQAPLVAPRAISAPDAGVPADVFSRVATRVGPRLSERLAARFVPDPAMTEALAQPIRGLGEWSTFALIGWIGGLVLVAFVAFRRWRETSTIVGAAVPADPALQAQAAGLCARLGLRRVPEVRVSGAIETPLVAGLLQPVILLPVERFTALTGREQEMALCHELAHLKRADLWFGCVPALAERLFFFHPLVRLASREYSLAREAACDAAVVDTLDAAPREYGNLLLSLGVSRPQTGAAAGAAGSFQHFKRRIAMLQDPPARSNRSRVVAVCVVILALAAIVPLRLVARPSSGALERSEARRAAKLAQRDLAPSDRVELERVERERTAQADQDDRRSDDSSVRFVLLLEDNQTTSSGNAADLKRARSHQRNGEPLLWFRDRDREYVVRDREVIERARAAWARVYESGLGVHAAALAQDFGGDLGRLLGEQVGRIASEAALAVAEPAAAFGAELGATLGAQLAPLGIEIASEALKSLQFLGPALGDLDSLKDLAHIDIRIDQAEIARLTRDAEKVGREAAKAAQEFQERFRDEISENLKRDLGINREQMRELRERMHDLERSLRDMKEPLKDLEDPMKELGRQMESLGRDIGERTRAASEDMRLIIRRAIESGIAQQVK